MSLLFCGWVHKAKAKQLLYGNKNMLSLWLFYNKLLQPGEPWGPPFSLYVQLGYTLMKTKGAIFIVTMQKG
jgi:hypothetical protein